MDAPALGVPGRLNSRINIASDGPGEATDFHVPDLAGNRLDRRKVSGAGYRESRFQHIHPKLGKLACEHDFLLRR